VVDNKKILGPHSPCLLSSRSLRLDFHATSVIHDSSTYLSSSSRERSSSSSGGGGGKRIISPPI